jgi:GNAT superfamily N-acetyltransferase
MPSRRRMSPFLRLYPVPNLPDLVTQNYRCWAGKHSEQTLLLRFMHQAYQELCPMTSLDHLNQTVEQLWSDQAGFWFIEPTLPTLSGEAQGCLWLGNAIDQVSGDRYTHIFLLYVCPAYRRRGLGTALMQRAETWAIGQGNSQIGLHVLVDSLAAHALYLQLGYAPQATFLQKRLSPTSPRV